MAQEIPLPNQPAPETLAPNPAPDPAKKNAMLFAIILGVVTVIVTIIFIVSAMNSDDTKENILEESAPTNTEIGDILPSATSSQAEFGSTEIPTEAEKGSADTKTIAPRPATSNSKTPVAPLVIPDQPFEDPALKKLQEQYLRQLEKLIYGKQNTGEDLSKLEPFVTISPYAGKITIRTVARSSSGNVKDEYVVLSTAKDLPENFHITGLILKSMATGQEVKIGEGVYLPWSNQINYKESIGVGPGSTIYILTGQPPVGYSFRVNKCSGYWTQFQSFKPTLRLNCPKVLYAQTPAIPPQLNDACLAYINKMGTCRIHIDKNSSAESIANDPYYQLQPECRQFIDKTAGYNNCVNLNKNETDFYTKEWRVYLERSSTLWKTKREIIQLLDDNRKVIAQYAY